MLDYTRWPLTVYWWPKNVGFPPRNHQWANNVFSRSGPVLIYNQWPKGTFVVAFQRLFATITPPVVSQWQSNIYLLLLDHCWSASDLPPSFCHLTAHKWLAHWDMYAKIVSFLRFRNRSQKQSIIQKSNFIIFFVKINLNYFKLQYPQAKIPIVNLF